MGEAVKSVFEATFAGVPPITGTIESSVWEVDKAGDEVSSNHIIRIDRDWIVRVKWSISGALASCICGDWSLHLYMESIGRGQEFHFPTDEDLHLELEPCKDLVQGRYEYEQDIVVPAGFVQEVHCDIPYKPVVSLTYRDVCERPGPMAGFVELPTIQFVRAGESETDLVATKPSVTHDVVVEPTTSTTKQRNNYYHTIQLVDETSDGVLTPSYLLKTVAPYLVAIEQMQLIINRILEVDSGHSTVRIHKIRQQSPVTVGLEGAAEVLEVLFDLIIPWRHSHKRELAKLRAEQEQAAVKKAQADALIAEIQADAEVDERRLEQRMKWAEWEKLSLEVEEKRTELYRSQLDLAIHVVERLAPDLTEREKIAHVIDLAKPLKEVSESPLTTEKPVNANDMQHNHGKET